MQFSDIFGALRRRWAFAVVPLLVVVAAGFYSVSTAPVVYQATSQAYVSIAFGGSANDLYQGSNYAQQQLSSFATLAKSRAVLNPVIKELGLSVSVRELSHQVQANASAETVILEISVQDSSPEQAAIIANAVTAQLEKVVDGLSPRVEGNKPAVRIVQTGTATPPGVPISPNKKRDLGAAGLGGLFLGVFCAVVRDRTDTRIRGRGDVPPGINVLGTVPVDRAIKKMGPAALVESPARGEAYRRVRTTLRFVDIDKPVQVFAVTSALPAEGKSTSALNLAQVFASAGGRVLLIDADLRKPRIADYLGIVGTVGLVDVLIGRAKLDDVLQKVLDGHLTVLPAGAIPPNPTELLGSRAMASLMDELRQRFDVVVLDTPPLLPVIDAAVLAPLTDGAIVVSRCRRTTRAQLDAAVGALDAVGARALGVVLTCVNTGRRQRSVYGNYSQEQASGYRRAEASAVGGRQSAALVSPAPRPEEVAPETPARAHLAQESSVPERAGLSLVVPPPSVVEARPAETAPDGRGGEYEAPSAPRSSGGRPFRPTAAGPRTRRPLWSDLHNLAVADELELMEIEGDGMPEDSTRPRRVVPRPER